MKEIQLTHGYTAKVDDQDFDFLSQFTWKAKIRKNRTYEPTIYPITRIHGKDIPMHSLLLPADYPRTYTDHKDRDGLNCQRTNLRIATPAQNSMNKCGWGKSGTKGVYFCPKKFRFRAEIQTKGIRVRSKWLKSQEEAADWYDKMASDIFGEFKPIPR